MTCDGDGLMNPTKTKNNRKLKLPNGKTGLISHEGDKTLENNLMLKYMLCVPEFKHNLLFVNKLVRNDNCKVTFYPKLYVIQH